MINFVIFVIFTQLISIFHHKLNISNIYIFYSQPAVTPKRPFPEDDRASKNHEADSERRKKQRKMEKLREYEDAKLKELRYREEPKKEEPPKPEVEVEVEENKAEIIEQVLNEESTEVGENLQV